MTTTTSQTKRALSLAMLSGAPLDAKDGPFTFVIDGNLPTLAASPNATAVLLSKATGAPVQVRNAKGETVATADYATLEAVERERMLLGRSGGGKERRAIPLTAAKQAMADLLRREGGATRADLVGANGGKGVSAWGVAKSLAERLGLVARRDLNQEPPRFWLAAQAEQGKAEAKASKPSKAA